MAFGARAKVCQMLVALVSGVGLLLCGLPFDAAQAADSRIMPSAVESSVVVAPSLVQVKRVRVSQARVSWSMVAGASKYEVLQLKSGTYRVVKTVAASKRSATVAKLKKHRTYTFKVRTVKTMNGKSVTSPLSMWVSTYTWTTASKQRNVKSIAGRSSYGTLDYYGSVKLTNRVKTAKRHKVVQSGLRYVSLTPRLVTVSGKGLVSASTTIAGTGKVRVIAHDGVSKTVNVPVQDMAMNGPLTDKISGMPTGITWTWRHERSRIGEIGAYFRAHHPAQGVVATFWEDDSGTFRSSNASSIPKTVQDQILALLDDDEYPVKVQISAKLKLLSFLIGEPVAPDDSSSFTYYSLNYNYATSTGWYWFTA